ncbi:hypothetical protein D1872_262130 [compost metagenome]
MRRLVLQDRVYVTLDASGVERCSVGVLDVLPKMESIFFAVLANLPTGGQMRLDFPPFAVLNQRFVNHGL